MSDKSKIEWTDATYNPIAGCSMVSPGCTNCYAMNMAHRFQDSWGKGLTLANGKWSGKLDIRAHKWEEPLRWRRPRKVFVCSGSDIFHEALQFETIAAVFGVMACAQRHTFQVLTKRPARAAEFFAWLRADKRRNPAITCIRHALERCQHSDLVTENPPEWPLRNIWLGVSTENHKTYRERIALLIHKCEARVRWISAEPLLGPIEISGTGNLFLDWVVAGGESGHGARPMNIDWARSLRDQCAEADIPFLFKQWGEFDADGNRTGKKDSGRLLDGVEHDAYPRAA